MDKIGVLFTCYNETNAVKYSLEQFSIHYPNSPVFLVHESNASFEFCKEIIKNISVQQGADTMFFYKHIGGENFKSRYFQELIKNATNTFTKRVIDAIDFCKTDYLLLMDPDTLVRGSLTIPENATLLGSRINSGFPEEIKNIFRKISGAKVINCWGATPAIINCDTYKKAYKKFYDLNILDDLAQNFYATYAHDVILPIMFALIGEEETYNPDIVECKRNFYWEQTTKPLVHQYKINY